MGGKDEEGSERRHDRRRKTLKSAKIIFNNNQSVFDCAVRDLSETGAKLALGDLLPLPSHFKLVLHDGMTHECEVIRHTGREIGVRFLVG
jgi:c-di-GMP-binding flagellar brake protein YcgR